MATMRCDMWMELTRCVDCDPGVEKGGCRSRGHCRRRSGGKEAAVMIDFVLVLDNSGLGRRIWVCGRSWDCNGVKGLLVTSPIDI